MSLAEVEQQVLQLSEEERRQFAAWFFQNQGKILPPPLDEGREEDGDVTEAMKAELLLRKQEYFDHPERFIRFNTDEELHAWFEEIAREGKARASSTRPV
jgi:hypothetical protein